MNTVTNKKSKCKCCGLPLTNADSIARGYGPDCAARMARYAAQKDAKEATLTTTVTLVEPKQDVVLIGLGRYGDSDEYVVVEKLPDGSRQRVPVGNFYDGREAAASAKSYASCVYLNNPESTLTPRMCIPSKFW